MEMNWLLKKKVIMIVNILLTIKKGRFTLEDKKTIKGYEGHYSITQSGKIYSHKRKRTMKRCGDEYGFHIVKLSKNGEATNHNVFELWKKHYPELNESEFKGAREAIY
ncbi:NUMOD4 domain-containing protein [Piscibacillus salipiscarius]|uniref:NUMOD4 domain-containing protein n=1 Tax=Piscibacillus salipiscarius TaxID=299480 RepID=A0ABW5QE55_9BACI